MGETVELFLLYLDHGSEGVPPPVPLVIEKTPWNRLVSRRFPIECGYSAGSVREMEKVSPCQVRSSPKSAAVLRRARYCFPSQAKVEMAA